MNNKDKYHLLKKWSTLWDVLLQFEIKVKVNLEQTFTSYSTYIVNFFVEFTNLIIVSKYNY